jgi:2-keto-3-deoxy-L-rhamnonate aldolase RhmA
MVRSADDVARAMSYARYPPAGVRGLGAERATMWGRRVNEYTGAANDGVLVIPVIETAEAAEDFDNILDVPGLSVLFFGPFDLAASLGYLGQCGNPQVWPRIDSMRARAHARGIQTGIVALTIDEGRRRIEEGYRMISLGFDTLLFGRAVQEMFDGLRAAGGSKDG